MTNFEKIKSMTKEEFAEWLDIHGEFDGSPWVHDFEAKYCKNCEGIPATVNISGQPVEYECAYCELNNKCKYFPDKEDIPNGYDMLLLWLDEEENKGDVKK